MSNAPIQERALLVSLNISQWTARKRDKAVTSATQRQYAASSDAGNFNKLLIGKEALDHITKVVSAARTHHYQVTLSWGDNGDRIMSGSMLLDYGQTMQQFESEFYSRVRQFEQEYPALIQDARKRLGSMYDPADYPPSIRDKFHFGVGVTPLATADDFRVSLSTGHVNQIKEQITRTFEERQKAAVKECYGRARELVGKIHEQTSIKDRKIYDSAIENARDFVKLLPALNLFGDPELTQLGDDIDALLVPAERLRTNKRLREDTAKAADAILSRLPWA